MVESIVMAIQSLGVHIIFIPPGCIGLVQPLDVRYNKTFRAKVKSLYYKWLSPPKILTRCAAHPLG
jgi:hypothetical protein